MSSPPAEPNSPSNAGLVLETTVMLPIAAATATVRSAHHEDLPAPLAAEHAPGPVDEGAAGGKAAVGGPRSAAP